MMQIQFWFFNTWSQYTVSYLLNASTAIRSKLRILLAKLIEV